MKIISMLFVLMWNVDSDHAPNTQGMLTFTSFIYRCSDTFHCVTMGRVAVIFSCSFRMLCLLLWQKYTLLLHSLLEIFSWSVD